MSTSLSFLVTVHGHHKLTSVTLPLLLTVIVAQEPPPAYGQIEVVADGGAPEWVRHASLTHCLSVTELSARRFNEPRPDAPCITAHLPTGLGQFQRMALPGGIAGEPGVQRYSVVGLGSMAPVDIATQRRLDLCAVRRTLIERALEAIRAGEEWGNDRTYTLVRELDDVLEAERTILREHESLLVWRQLLAMGRRMCTMFTEYTARMVGGHDNAQRQFHHTLQLATTLSISNRWVLAIPAGVKTGWLDIGFTEWLRPWVGDSIASLVPNIALSSATVYIIATGGLFTTIHVVISTVDTVANLILNRFAPAVGHLLRDRLPPSFTAPTLALSAAYIGSKVSFAPSSNPAELRQLVDYRLQFVTVAVLAGGFEYMCHHDEGFRRELNRDWSPNSFFS